MTSLPANLFALLLFAAASGLPACGQAANDPVKTETNVIALPATNTPTLATTNTRAAMETNSLPGPGTNLLAKGPTNVLPDLGTNSPAKLETNPPGRLETNTPTRLDYDSFKIIADRNIFNPNRSSRASRAVAPPPKQVKIETFSLLGTLCYDKGRFAFFDGTSSAYQKVLKPADAIGGFTVKVVAANHVKLATGGKDTELRVGGQMRREDEGEWRLVVQAETFPTTSTAAVASDSAEAGDSAEESEVLKKLMQKREQELNK